MSDRIPPWFHAPCDGWESARDRLPRPFTREEAIADLRWWAHQVDRGRPDPRTGRRLHRMPGRARLVEEWGWDQGDRVHTPAAVKRILGDPALRRLWLTPRKAPAPARANASNGRKSASATGEAPAKRQRSASRAKVEAGISEKKRQQGASEAPVAQREPAGKQQYRGAESTRKREATTDLPPTPQGGGGAGTDAERLLVSTLERWSHRWRVVGAVQWWRTTIAPMADRGPLDLHAELRLWAAWLDDADQRPDTGRGARFPVAWRTALLRWMTNAAGRYAAPAGPPTKDPTNEPTDRPRRRHRRRGVARGQAPSAFTVRTEDAGG